MCFKLSDQTLQKTFWVYYGAAHDPGTMATWFLVINWVNVVIAILQFYFGYRKLDK